MSDKRDIFLIMKRTYCHDAADKIFKYLSTIFLNLLESNNRKIDESWSHNEPPADVC